ncbi:MAG: SRPBCC family protein [Bacteroidetes bacterium]|nr:SRPBCC family protein [Bacteroidota bacterium]
MKKFIKITLWVLLAVVVGLLLIGLVAPKKFDISRTAYIKASRVAVWEQINPWKNHEHWSPWYKKDTSMKITIAGTDGEVGASYAWESDEMGKGKQTIKEVKPMDFRASDLAIEGWGNPSMITFSLSDSAEGTKVIWRMQGENGYFGSIFALLFNMNKMMGKDFEDGLGFMKTYIESNPASPESMPAMESKPADSSKGK